MSPRTDLLAELAGLTNGAIRVVDEQTGWPGIVQVGPKAALVSLHVGRVGLSGRGRDAVERRYQNPAACPPIVANAGTAPMLLGLWTQENSAVIVAHDAYRRLGPGGTRDSFFVGLVALRTAASTGWAEYVNASGERIVAFRPELFPMYAEMFLSNVLIDPVTVASVLSSAGVAQGDPASVERARRATSVLVRDEKFRNNVVAAYGGCCAMCGLGLSLVEGAHIYPASAPGSSDEVHNGLALCPSHHRAFDRYYLWIDPGAREILIRPDIKAQATASPAAMAFLSSTVSVLGEPLNLRHRPTDQAIAARNDYYADAYSWASGG